MNLKRFACVAAVAAGSLGCAGAPLPPTPAPAPPRPSYVINDRFDVGALSFGETELERAIPAMILTELKATERFNVLEAGGIRRKPDAVTSTGPSSNIVVASGEGGSDAAAVNLAADAASEAPVPLREETVGRFVDGYISGTVTQTFDDKVCFDVRLSNSHNHHVLYAKSVCSPFAKVTAVEGAEKPKVPERDAIKSLASDIARAIKKIEAGAVVNADGRLVTVNRGEESGVMPGMVAFIVGTGDSTNDSKLHKSIQKYTGSKPGSVYPTIVGEIYVVSVGETESVGVLLYGSYAIPGDTVFFK